MKRSSMRKWLSLLVCVVLTAAMALCMMGCDQPGTPSKPTEPSVFSNGDTIGEGTISFTLEVVDAEENTATALVYTDKTILGEALQELGLIKGEVQQYGLYIKTVNGITYDYNRDGVYWGLYIDGEYAILGVDMTEIEAGKTYTLKAVRA